MITAGGGDRCDLEHLDGFDQRSLPSHTRPTGGSRSLALTAAHRSVASLKWQSFFPISDEADHVLERRRTNVQAGGSKSRIAKSDFAATREHNSTCCRATSDVTRTRTTRLSAIYFATSWPLHVWRTPAQVSAEALDSDQKSRSTKRERPSAARAPTSRVHQKTQVSDEATRLPCRQLDSDCLLCIQRGRPRWKLF